LKLPPEDRALLAGALDASLGEGDDQVPRDPAVGAAWRDEIARRVKEYREGEVVPIPAEQVHADALAAIARARALRGGPSSS
jgi:putative addiction module component (TIGR02574 family)